MFFSLLRWMIPLNSFPLSLGVLARWRHSILSPLVVVLVGGTRGDGEVSGEGDSSDDCCMSAPAADSPVGLHECEQGSDSESGSRRGSRSGSRSGSQSSSLSSSRLG